MNNRTLRSWFKDHLAERQLDGTMESFTLDKDQAAIVLDNHENTLVTARAGSGKTRTIIAKAAYLIAHEGLQPEEVIVFAFNRKARAEVNFRLRNIYYDGAPLLKSPYFIATTFHAFAYHTLLDTGFSIPRIHPPSSAIDFPALLDFAAPVLFTQRRPYKYILIDEYQDFSAPFFKLITSLRIACRGAKLLAVGDDWQAINRFAGSDLTYFQNFAEHFDDDSTHLYITSNYRSGKRIVETANYFMGQALKEYHGGKSRRRIHSHVYVRDISQDLPPVRLDRPILLESYLRSVIEIIKKHPGKSIKILNRNNDLSFNGWSLERFMRSVYKACPKDICRVSWSTIHRAKGLESDIVVLLEIDAKKFPNLSKDPDADPRQVFEDEARLFYVALTRAKERLYILTKTPRVTKANRAENFLAFMNEDWLEEF